MSLLRLLPLALLLAVSLPAQEAVAIKAGKVLTMAGAPLTDAVILIENGRIAKIGTALDPSWNARLIDASDKTVAPTWILAHTAGGIAGGASENLANVPYLTVEDGVDPASDFFEDALRNGIGTIHVMPGDRTLIGGRGLIVRPVGRTVADMTVGKGGLKLSLDAGDGSRIAHIGKLRRALEDVQTYQRDLERRRAEFDQAKAAGATKDAAFTEEADSERKPVIALLEGKSTAFLYVPSAAEMTEALLIRTRHGFPTVLVLGGKCHPALRALSRQETPVVLDPDLEVWDTDPETEEETLVCPAARCFELGVPFALSIGTNGAQRFPWWQMATAIRHGVDRRTALAAMTTVPARLLGLEADLGSLEQGKIANLQILTGDPLAATTWVDTVLIEGQVVYERAKDRRLRHLFGRDDNDGR
jgi:imidazolonepropionase-like amidohydrolase